MNEARIDLLREMIRSRRSLVKSIEDQFQSYPLLILTEEMRKLDSECIELQNQIDEQERAAKP